MTYSPVKFEVATSNGLGGDAFTMNGTDTHTYTFIRTTDLKVRKIVHKILVAVPIAYESKKGSDKPVHLRSQFEA